MVIHERLLIRMFNYVFSWLIHFLNKALKLGDREFCCGEIRVSGSTVENGLGVALEVPVNVLLPLE